MLYMALSHDTTLKSWSTVVCNGDSYCIVVPVLCQYCARACSYGISGHEKEFMASNLNPFIIVLPPNA
jgi:hypothetical protein